MECDFCGKSGRYMIDGKTRQGSWAIMCDIHWSQNGVGKYGTGFGQRYKHEQTKGYVKIAG